MIALTLNARIKKFRLFIPADVSFCGNRITVVPFKTKGSNGGLIVSYDKYRGREIQGGHEKYGKFTITFHDKDKSATIKTDYPELFSLFQDSAYRYSVKIR